ncbi:MULTISPECIES: hypothetical protein [unclassified Pseudonocardia]|uniref:hypothetical protein n=1 Tax=unclassified Pseudonocardia TaxID=2619320 RepID=UPI000A5BBC98|nr:MULTISPECIES: hypothetical protein [unclassified Pseudonocardia]
MAQHYRVVAEWIVGSLAEADRMTERLLDGGVETISVRPMLDERDGDGWERAMRG